MGAPFSAPVGWASVYQGLMSREEEGLPPTAESLQTAEKYIPGDAHLSQTLLRPKQMAAHVTLQMQAMSLTHTQETVVTYLDALYTAMHSRARNQLGIQEFSQGRHLPILLNLLD